MNDSALTQIPTNLQPSICNLVNRFATKICNQRRYINKYKKLANERKQILKKHGLLNHGSLKRNKYSRSGTYRTVKLLDKCAKTLNKQINDRINLQEEYLLHQFRVNPHVFNIITPKMEKIWLKKQIKNAKKMAQNNQNAIRIALTGIINSWTQRQWNSFNSSVEIYCFLGIYIYVYL